MGEQADMLSIFCPDCKEHTNHSVKPWQTAAGVRGAVSIFCEKCARLSIAEIAKLTEVKFLEREGDN